MLLCRARQCGPALPEPYGEVSSREAKHPMNVITGASAGLGKALALQYAIPERSLGLLGRDKERLGEVADACRACGAEVTIGAFDLLEAKATSTWMRAFDAAQPIDLLIVNAGVFTGHGADGAMETDDEIMAMLAYQSRKRNDDHRRSPSDAARPPQRPHSHRRLARRLAAVGPMHRPIAPARPAS